MKYEILKSTSGGYWWRVKASNGQILATSELYTSKQSCLNAISTVQGEAADAPTYDLTGERAYSGRF